MDVKNELDIMTLSHASNYWFLKKKKSVVAILLLFY